MNDQIHNTLEAFDERAARIEAVLLDVLQRRLAGEDLADEQVLSEHPELMPQLGEELQLAADMQSGNVEVESKTELHSPASSGAIRIRCPHCQQPVEVLSDTPFTDITCSGCGSQFSLAGEATETQAARTLKKLGHFDLIERLGFGSFGTVWKARDTELDRTVAIKIPRHGKLAPDDVEQFLREARAAAQLNHPYIVSVHEVGRDYDTVYIVSDLVRGVSLADWLSGQQRTFREAAKLCAKIAEALHHAHEAGVVHRDLKPQNVMIDADAEPHLMDFGLARRDVGEVTMTMDGHVLGTPAYMSPEQARGEAHLADRRTDIYSLGVILFELLTGELPFRGNARMLIHQVLNEDAPSPRSLNNSVPRDLETICLKCLEKDPSKRFDTAQQVADEFRRFLNGQPITARRITQLERAWRWCKRNPIPAGLTLAVGVSLLLGAIISSYFWRQSSIRADESDQRASDLRRTLYATHVNLAHQAIQERNFGKGLQLLQRYVPKPGEADIRGWEWRYLWQFGQSPSKALGTFSSGVRSLVVDPNGRYVVIGTHDGEVYRISTNGQQQQLIANGLKYATVSMSPKGDWLTACGDGGTGGVRIWQLPSGDELPTLRPAEQGDQDPIALAFSGDGRRLAALFPDRLIVWDVPGGQVVGQVSGLHAPRITPFHGAVQLSHDGTRAFVGDIDGTLTAYDVRSKRQLWNESSAHPEGITVLALSRDDTLLATGAGFTDSAIKLWDTSTGKQKSVLEGHSAWIASLEFSLDGRVLVSGSADQTCLIWDVGSGTHSDPLIGHLNEVWDVSLTSDGSRLYSCSKARDVRVWDVGQSSGIQAYASRRVGGYRSLDFDPHGRFIMAKDLDGRVVLLDPITLNVTEELDTLGVVEGPAVLSPNGRYIAATTNKQTLIYDRTTQTIVQRIAEFSGTHFVADGQGLFGPVGIEQVGTIIRTRDWQPLPSSVNSPHEKLYLRIPSDSAFSRSIGLAAFKASGRHVVLSDFSMTSGFVDSRVITTHEIDVLGVSLSPTGALVASCDGNGYAHVIDTRSGERLMVLHGHQMGMFGVGFITEDRLATGGQDREALILWDITTEQELLTFSLDGAVWLGPIKPSPDGSIIAALSWNNDEPVLHRWRAPSFEELGLLE